MANTKKTQQHDNLEDIESALTRTEQFIEDHQYKIFYAIGAIVLIVVGYLAFTRFYIAPREKEAQAQMFRAEQYFAKDSFNLALNGDGNYLGFLDIIDTYSSTEPGSLARYYAGISYLNLGQYQEAIDQLGKFDTDDLVLEPVSQGAIGDAYLELGNQDKALKQYEKAIALSENELTAPVYMMKAGNLLEGMNQPEKALKYYQEIKTKFAATAEGRNADKYIARVNASLVK